MTKNSEIAIDDLIKRIYKSYVEIKVGEFREIDRDMLLNDIGLLYTSIKDLYPSNQLPAIEFDLIQKKLNTKIPEHEDEIHPEPKQEEQRVERNQEDTPEIERVIPMELMQSPIEVKISEGTPSPEEEIQKEDEITTMDLSMFEDAEQLESPSLEASNLIDKKSDNTTSPILQGFQTETKEVNGKLLNYQDIPTVVEKAAEVLVTKVEEVPSAPKKALEEESPIVQTLNHENDRKSKSDIMDFLHHDDKKTAKDIYSFLDLNTRIGLIELFFKGNSLELTECLVWLNKLDTKEACVKVIDKFAAKFDVGTDDEIYKQFLSLVDRKLDYQK
ncbi:MAG: hypothetical protein ACK58Q_10555 [Chitinophagales bacterium]